MRMGETGLYRLFASNGVLLYIGISQHPNHRIGDHRRQQPWARLIDDWSIEVHATRHEALWEERQAIIAEHPLFNRDANMGRERPWFDMLEASGHERPALTIWRIEQFAGVALVEPRILEVMRDVLALDTRYCGECEWRGIRERIAPLVGWDAEEPILRYPHDYETVVSTLYECLPWSICASHAAA